MGGLRTLGIWIRVGLGFALGTRAEAIGDCRGFFNDWPMLKVGPCDRIVGMGGVAVGGIAFERLKETYHQQCGGLL